MDTIECLMTRRSIRKYTDRPVDEGVVKQLLKAAMSAPSSANEQPWQFVVIKDRKILREASGIHTFSYMLDQAALAILVCEDPTFEFNTGRGPLDCSAATMSILLAAHALGLGAVWVGIFPVQERMERTRSLLDIPPHIIPIAFVSLGYPDETPHSEERFKAERVHYDHWTGGMSR